MRYGAPSPENEFLWEHVRHLLWSYEHFVGIPMMGFSARSDCSVAKEIFYAPFALVSHGTEEDPVFNYANQTALTLFEMQWQAFTSMPSKYSAQPMSREERAALLSRVTQDGYIDDYSGVRIAKSQRKFRIEQATVWNVLHREQGHYIGQAAIFSCWQFLDTEREH